MEVKSCLLQEHQMLEAIVERPSLEGRSFTGTPRLSAFSCTDTSPGPGSCSQASQQPSTQSSTAVFSSVPSSAFAEVRGRLRTAGHCLLVGNKFVSL